MASDPAEHAFSVFLAALGLDDKDPHLAETPRRVATLYRDVLNGGAPFTFTTFPADGIDQMIYVGRIPFTSFCAHHLLPFTGTAHIAYLPGDRIAGLSKFARVVQHYAASPQVQERLTRQIADRLEAELNPVGVAVVLDARHACMELRGAKATGAVTTTSDLRGPFRTNPSARAELLALARRDG